MHMNLSSRLQARERELGRPVRIGLAGAGQMGIGFVAQVRRIPGMEVAAIADVLPGRPQAAFAQAGINGVVEGDDPDKLARAVADGRPVGVADARLLTDLPVDVVVDATGVPDVGAFLAYSALLGGKDVASLNAEADVTIGLLLSKVAHSSGQVYALCKGDEPVEVKELFDYVTDIGFEVVCAGKGKNNPLQPHATPDTVAEEAAVKHMNPKMLASFVDGSKTMIECASMANATGLELSRRGMYGPDTTVPELANTFRPAADGGILDRPGVVDYATGPVAPGVFIVGRTDHPTVLEEMAYLSMGPGPYYAFYRPYHLASLEAPLTVARAALDRVSTLEPVAWKAEVVATAKRELRPGDQIDGIGGATVYGVADAAEAVAAGGLLPLGLAARATVVRDVGVDQPLTYDDVELDDGSTILQLRRLQDQLLGDGTRRG
jgi:predicted homoserine dehydrogenase-like protein